MSKATKCDRCGGFYEQGGKNVRQGWGSMSDEYDLCPDCAESFDAWLERGQMADTSERATESAEMAHDTGEKLEAAAQTAAGYIYGRGFTNGLADAWNDDEVDAAANQIIQLLDRQAAITEQECAWRWQQIAENRDRAEMERDELSQRIQTLEREIATLKEHRAGNMEKLHELTDECAELRKYRDEWKGLAEKYRADSIAAQEETERYRAKLGDVLDAIHDAERAAR